MASIFDSEEPIPEIFAGQFSNLSRISGLYLITKDDNLDDIFSPESFVSDLVQNEKLLTFQLNLKLTLWAQKIIKDLLVKEVKGTKAKDIIFKAEKDELKDILANNSTAIMTKTQKKKSAKLSSNKEINEFINSRMKVVEAVLSSIEEEITSIGKEVIKTLSSIETISQAANKILEKIKLPGGPISDGRIKRIARTETVIAQNAGIFNAVKILSQAKKIKQIQWVTVLARRVRHSHRKMHGKKVKVGNYFLLPSGVKMKYPCDPDAIGNINSILKETINCRCTVRTVS